MSTVRVPAGIIRGESKAAIPGRFSDGNLIRWQEGKLKPVGGWQRMTQTPLASTPRWGFVYLDDKFQRRMGVICDAHVYVQKSSDFLNITPVDWRNAEKSQTARGFGSGNYARADYGEDTEDRGGQSGNPNSDNFRERAAYPVAFSAEKWGQDEFLFGSSGDGRVFVYSPTTHPIPIVCPNAPTLIQCFITTDERHLMVGGGGGFPNRVAWSDQGNREGWNFVDVEGQAGYFDLQDAGTIYCMRKIPGAILIFTQTSVWVCRYIGYPNFYGFTKLSENVAPVSPQAVVVAANRCFWWGQGSFFKYEGGVVAPVPCDLAPGLFEEIDTFNAPRRITGGFNGVFNEIWWFFPTRGRNSMPVENDRYVIYNFVEGWWSYGRVDRSFFMASPIDTYPVAGTTTGNIYAHEQGYKAEQSSRAGVVWAEVGTLSFEDGDRIYSVQQIQTDSGGDPQNVRFEFDCRMARGGPNLPTEKFTPRADGYVDARFSARDFTMRVIGMVDAPWAVGALIFDSKARGKR